MGVHYLTESVDPASENIKIVLRASWDAPTKVLGKTDGA